MENPTGNNYNKHGIIPFKGDNYPDWSFRVQMLLEEQDLWTKVSTAQNAAARAVAGWSAADLKARRIIVDCVDNKCLEYVKGKDTAHDMWSGLNTMYNASSYTKRVMTFKKMIRLTYNLTESMQSFFHTFDVISRDYTSAGGTLEATELIVIMLSCLPDDFSAVVTAISTIPENQFTADKVRGFLLEEESRIRDRLSLTSHESSEVTTAFYNNSNIRCYNCGTLGHKSDVCSVPPKKTFENKDVNVNQKTKDKKKKYWNKYKGKNSGKPGGSGHALMVSNEKHDKNDNNRNIVRFVCDTACSNHLINDVSLLCDVKSIEPLTIKLAKEGGSLKVTKVGTLKVKAIVNGREIQELTISNVHYCPDASVNLLSLGTLDDKGVEFKVSRGVMKATRDGETLFIAKKCGRLYHVNFELQSYSANLASSTKASSTLWHRRLAHLSMQSICRMKKLGMVKGLCNDLSNDIDFCDCCVKTKITRDKFTGTRPITKRPLERVHSDVCGPFPKSYDGYQYFVTFIDDYTHVTNIYLLKHKSEVLSKFELFCESAEAHFGSRVSRLRCDNGGEYTSNDFKNFCARKGITIEYTVPYNPQMNGVSERMNRTICEKMRALLFESKLPEHFWSEAILTSTYLTNRSSTVTLKGKTPFEMWYGRKPDISNLRVFGCKGFGHVPHEKRKGKLSLRGTEYVFMGYAIDGYRLFDVDDKKIVMGRSVTFNECAPAVTTAEITSTTVNEVSVASAPSTVNQSSAAVMNSSGRIPISPLVPNTPNISFSHHSPFNTSTPVLEQTSSPIVVSTPVRSRPPASQTSDDSTEEFSTPMATTPVTSRYPRRQRLRPFWQRTGEFDLSARYAFFTGNRTDEVPKTFSNVSGNQEEAEWRSAIDEEIRSLMKNHTWDVVDYPVGAKVLDSRWIFKKKLNGPSCIHKARLVAKGYMQKEGVDFTETYAPVARLQTIRILLALGNKFDLDIEHMDVKTAFLNGDLEEEVYMKSPQGITIPNGKVLKLRKSLYGLKQAPRCWNLKFHEVMIKLGFKRSDSEPCLYIKSTDRTISIIVLYVDDMLYLSNDKQEMKLIKQKMSEEFELKELGNVENFMGLKVERDRAKGILAISQGEYAREILERFDMAECKPRSIPIETKLDLETGNGEDKTTQPYRELLGSLMYLMLGTRPDLSFAVNKMSRYQENATDQHWSYLKSILRYVRGTTDYKLIYSRDDDNPISAFADSDWANDREDRKSTTGYLIKVFGNVVVWSSKKQQQVTLSSTEAEYVAACAAVQETLWIEKLLTDLDIEIDYPIEIYEDNFGCVMISKNPETKRSKHIDVRFHFLRNLVWEGRYVLKQVSTDLQQADILTKGLSRQIFEKFVGLMSLKRGEVLKHRD